MLRRGTLEEWDAEHQRSRFGPSARAPPSIEEGVVFTSMFPILSSPDLPRLLHFYVSALDARETYRFPAEGAPSFVGVDVAGQHLGLGFDGEAPPTGVRQRVALWFYAESCDDAVERLRAAGATVVSEPTDMEWGERVAQVLDPDGNVLHVGQAATET